MAKRKKKVVLEIEKDRMVQVGNSKLFQDCPTDKNGYFLVNPNVGKPMPKGDYIVWKKTSRLYSALIKNNTAHTTFEMSVEEIEAFAKLARKRQDYFDRLAKKRKSPYLAECFFLHFNPELTIFFRK